MKRKKRKRLPKSDLILIHISDLHIGQNKQTTNGASNILAFIVKRYKKLSKKTFVIITGDIWNSFGERDKSIAKGVFEKSQIFETFTRDHVLICPGNHDSSDYYRKNEREIPYFFRDFPSYIVHKTESTCYHFIGLDSSRNKRNLGHIGEDQFKFLSEVLIRIKREKKRSTQSGKAIKQNNEEEEMEGEETDENKKKSETIQKNHKTILYLHHNPFITFERKKLQDRQKFLKIVRGHRKIDVFLCGHYHRYLRMNEDEEKYKIPVILSSGKSSSIKTFRELRMYQNGKMEVNEIKITKK